VKLNLHNFILILPVCFSWIAINENPQLVFASLIVMSLAEVLRQYLSVNLVKETKAPRQLFFFGVIYKDSEGFFLNRSTLPVLNLKNNRKWILLLAVFILSLAMRVFPAFEGLNLSSSLYFSLIITLWVSCSTYKELSRIMLLQILGTLLAFGAAEDPGQLWIVIWLFISFWAQLKLHTWQLLEESRFEPGDSPVLTTADILKSLVIVVVLIFSFRVADYFVPVYDQAQSSTGAMTVEAEKSKPLTNKPRVPKKLLQEAAKLKLKAGLVDFSKIKSGNFKLPSFGSEGPKAKWPGSSLSQYGENRKALESIKNDLDNERDLKPEDLEKLRGLAKSIKQMPGAGQDSADDTVVDGSTGKPAKDNATAGAKDSGDNAIEERIDKLKGYTKNTKLSDDDASEYMRLRKEISDEVDKLMVLDEKKTLLKEELSLQKLFDKVVDGLKRFSLLIAMILILTWWLSKKASTTAAEGESTKAFSLPKEVRLQLKSLYKLLLKGNFSAKEEVLKSYYLLELAFKEFEFARGEDLPPLVFLEKLKGGLPAIAKPAETPIDLFCRVFYGDKLPAESEIKQLRTNMRELMKKLKVI